MIPADDMTNMLTRRKINAMPLGQAENCSARTKQHSQQDAELKERTRA